MKLTDDAWHIIQPYYPNARLQKEADRGGKTKRCLRRSFGYATRVRRGRIYWVSICLIKPATGVLDSGLPMGR